MPKSEKDDAISQLTSRILTAMLDELILDTTLKSHHEVARSKTICPTCNTRCVAIHTPGSAHNTSIESSKQPGSSSRAATPSSAASNEFTSAKRSANGTSTPSGKDGNLYLECLVCSRQIASNRYATHLASCMGVGSARRNGARGPSKVKLPSDAGRSASPMSEGGNGSDDRPIGQGKSKSKDDGEFSVGGNGKRKRVGSPQISPNKKKRQGKPAASPVSRVKAEPDLAGFPSNPHFSPSASSQSKVPSKLRDSSTSLLERSSTMSRDSSPDAARTPGSSFSAQSPAQSRTNGKPPRGRPPPKGTGPPPKRPSPPRPQPIHVSHYDEIDHANETGSSTDTDSD